MTEGNLIQWLDNTVDRFPSYNVKKRERQPQRRSVHCRNCGQTYHECRNCGAPFVRKPEKGIDAAIVTDLLLLGWQRAYEVAVLVSSDADFVPAVQAVQAKGLKVVNASWSGHGHELKRSCWGSFDLDQIAARICR